MGYELGFESSDFTSSIRVRIVLVVVPSEPFDFFLDASNHYEPLID